MKRTDPSKTASPTLTVATGGPIDSTRRGVLRAIGATTLGLSGLVAAQPAPYPSRPVRIIVGVDPGGPSDLISRNAAQILTVRTGQSFVVENRGGAGGAIGLRALASSVNDGYTLGWGSFSSLVLRPAVNVSSVPFDVEKELMPVSLLAEQAFVLCVNPSLGVNTLAELVKLIKANPGKYNFGSPGPGGLPHLLFELLKKREGLDMTHIPYKGDAQAFQSLVAGHIHMLLTAPNLYGSSVERVRIVAIAAPNRSPQYPQVPTFEQAGLPGYGYTAWHALIGPQGVSRAIVERVDRELRAGLSAPEGRAAVEKMGLVPSNMTYTQFAARFSDESTQWRRIVKELNLSLG